jgi:hypothetical protein
MDGDTLEYLQKFLQCIKYIILEFIPLLCSLSSPSPDSWNSFNRCHYLLSNSFYKASITLIPKPSKDASKEQSYRPTFLIKRCKNPQ